MADANILISELYGKVIITNTGRMLGSVEDLIVDFEAGQVSTLLLVKSEELMRSDRASQEFIKNSVRYERVKSVDQTIIVSGDTARN
jgi:sporulation protein YlmC with PRC-barrel domain